MYHGGMAYGGARPWTVAGADLEAGHPIRDSDPDRSAEFSLTADKGEVVPMTFVHSSSGRWFGLDLSIVSLDGSTYQTRGFFTPPCNEGSPFRP